MWSIAWERPEILCGENLIWLWIDAKLIKAALLLWRNFQASLSNSNVMTNPDSTRGYQVHLAPAPLYARVQTGSNAENAGIIGSSSFSTRIPPNSDFSELSRSPPVCVCEHIWIIFILVQERQHWITKKVLNMRWGELVSLKALN